MRIGIFDPYLDDIGGGEKYMLTIAKVLSEENQVDIFWDNPQDLQTATERFGIDMGGIAVVPNIFKPSVGTLERFLSTREYESIIILSDGSIPLIGSKKLFVHIQQPLEYMQGGLLGFAKLARVTKFFCNSFYTKSFLQKKFHFSPEVIYPPVKLYPIKAKKENIILHVGRFRVKNVSNGDYKKQSVMINVFKDMVDKGLKGWEFVLAVSFGEKDKSEFENMRKLAQGYPIRFIINQTNKALWNIYAKAKIYWHASGYGEDLVLHPEYAEHFGISTVEAMGAGAVPVVINAGGQKEIVTQGETGYVWDRLEELEKQTSELIHNPGQLEKISKEASLAAQKFTEHEFERKIKAMVSK